MAALTPTHRILLLEASDHNDEVNPDNHAQIEYIEELFEWGYVDDGYVLTKLGQDAVVNIRHGLVVHVRKTGSGE